MNPAKIGVQAKSFFYGCVGALLIFSGGTASANPPSPASFDTGSENQLGLTFAPDGTTAFWVNWSGSWGSNDGTQRQIYSSQLHDGAWSTATPMEFGGEHSDDDPFVSPDGRWLYFVSDRPTSVDDNVADTNIWRYNLGIENDLQIVPVNSDAAEYSPVVTESGAIYFASDRTGGQGAGDLYRAIPTGDGFGSPQPLGPAFNTPDGEWNLWVSADENEIVFEASSRPTNVSTSGDLYYSWRTAAGWTPPLPVASLNSRNSDLMPRLHPDGKSLYYTSAPIGGQARTEIAEWGRIREQLRSEYAPELVVANRSSHEVTFIDLSLGEISARVETGEGPHLLSNVSDGRILASGFGEFPKPHADPVSNRPPFLAAPNSRITLIDTVDKVVLFDTTVEDCRKPHSSWIVANRAYVTCETEKYIAVIDLDEGEAIGRLETLQNGSHVLSFEPTSRILASSNVDSGSITLINIDSGETRVVELAAGSEGAVAINGRIWVANGTDGSVSIVEPQTGAVVEHIDSVCAFPIALSRDAEGQVWVACFASAELVSIDPVGLVIQRRIKLGDQPLNVLVHPQRQLAYVSLPRRNAVAEVDLASGREVRRIGVGIEPDGLRWASQDPVPFQG